MQGSQRYQDHALFITQCMTLVRASDFATAQGCNHLRVFLWMALPLPCIQRRATILIEPSRFSRTIGFVYGWLVAILRSVRRLIARLPLTAFEQDMMLLSQQMRGSMPCPV